MADGCRCYGGPDWDCPVHGPCQGCTYVTGAMTSCTGACDGLTAENMQQMAVDYDRAQLGVSLMEGLRIAFSGREND